MNFFTHSGNLLLKRLKQPSRVLKWISYQLSLSNERNTYLITMPQSGTHWIQALLVKSFVDYYDLDYEIKGLGTNTTAPILRSDYVGNINEKIPQVQTYHFRYFFLFRSKKVIFLIRDLRDAMVSQYDKYKRNHNDTSFSELLRKGLPQEKSPWLLEDRIKLLNSWGGNKSKTDKFLVVKYENLKEDAERELRKILNIVGIPEVSDDFLSNVVDFCSVENMKKIEKKSKGEFSAMNKGKAGRYQYYFSEQDLEYFRKIVDKKLDYDFGYDYFSD